MPYQISRYILLLSIITTYLGLAQDNYQILQVHSNCINQTNMNKFDNAYEKSPTKFTNTPTVVMLTANAKLVSISDAPEGKVSINFDIWQSWSDPRLAFHEPSSSGWS